MKPEQSAAIERLLRTVVVSSQRSILDKVIHMTSSGKRSEQVLTWAMQERAKLELPDA